MAEVESPQAQAEVRKSEREDTVFTLVERDKGILNLVFDSKGEKVNILTADAMLELSEILDELHRRDDVTALIFLSGKEDNFIAGADVGEIRDVIDSEEGAAKARQSGPETTCPCRQARTFLLCVEWRR